MKGIKNIKAIKSIKRPDGIIKAAAFAAVILGAVFTIQYYQLKYITRMQETVYAVGDKEVAKTLARGEEPENLFSGLLEIKEDEAVYRRGSAYYAGEAKTKLEKDFPFYANGGNALMIMESTGKLVNTAFEETDTFQGMYVSDGLSFNYDKSQADEDSFYFLKLGNGLYINVQPILFSYPGGESRVRMNSIFYFGKDSARYYAPGGENMLQYGAVPTVSMATVTIGGETFSYEELLLKLGLAGDGKNRSRDKDKVNTDGAVEAELEEEPEKNKAPEELTGAEEGEIVRDGDLTLGEEEREDERKTGEELTDAQKKTDKVKKERQPKEKKEKPDKNQGSQGTGSTGGAGNAAGSGSASGSGSSAGGGSTGGGQNGNKPSGSTNGGAGDVSGNEFDPEDISGNDISGNDISGNDVSGNNAGGFKFRLPTAELGEFVPDIYNVASTLKIKDISGCLRRVVLEFCWQDALPDGSPAPESDDKDLYKSKYRKTFRASGDILIDNLPPGTNMYVRGIIYYVEDGETKNYEFYDGFEHRFTTKSLSTVDDLYVEFQSEPRDNSITRKPYQMQLFEFAVSGENQNVVDKISRVRITATETASKEVYTLQMPISEARRNYFYREKPEERPVWESDVRQVSLPSDKNFTYQIELLDPFGTPFKNVIMGYKPKGEKDWDEEKSLSLFTKDPNSYVTALNGTFQTAKAEPSVEITNRSRDIDQAVFRIRTQDPDQATASHKDTYRLCIYREGETDPVSFQVKKADGTTETVTALKLTAANMANGGEETYTVDGLTAGCNYEARVLGNYDLSDRSGVYTDRIVGTLPFSTIPLANYGQVYYNLSGSHVKTEYQPDGHIDYDEDDQPILSKYESATAQKVYLSFNYRITKADLVNLYVNRIHLEVEDVTNGGTVLKADLMKDQMKKISVTGTGSGKTTELYACGMEDIAENLTTLFERNGNQYAPKIYVEMTDPGAGVSANLWDVFIRKESPAKLVLYWEDGSLLSNLHNYRIDLTTYAAQGDREHNVTGQSTAARRLSFTTLKKMPYVTFDDILLASDYIRIYGLNFHDEDKAITGGVVQTALVGQSEAKYTLSYENGEDGVFTEPLIYKDLLVGRDYQITLTGEQIRRDKEGRYLLRGEELKSFPFTAGAGISGSLTLDNIAYPLEGTENILQSEYSVYDGSDYRTGLMDNVTGVAADTTANTSGWSTSPYIKVEPGEYYYLDGLAPVKTYDAYIQFYTDEPNPNNREEKKPLALNTTSWSASAGCNRVTVFSREDVIEIPEGAKYMRFSMRSGVNGIQCYATAECYRLPKQTDDHGKTWWGAPERQILTEVQGNTVDNGSSVYLEYVVEGGARYGFNRRNRNFRYEFWGNGTKISEYTPTGYFGWSETAPQGADTLRVYNASGGGISGDRDFCANKFKLCRLDGAGLAWLGSRNTDTLTSAFTLEVQDRLNNLVLEGDNKVYLELSRYDEEKRQFVTLTGKDNPIDAFSKDLKLELTEVTGGSRVTEDLISSLAFNGGTNQRFQLKLSVKYKGKEDILLDTLEFDTNRVKEIISDRTDLAKLMRNPAGDFLVVKDIELRDNEWFYSGNGNAPFEGTIDFQGHTLKRKDTTGGTYGFYTINSGAVVENLVFDYTMDNSGTKNEVNWNRSLAAYNYGTIRNMILELNLGSGMYRKSYMGGICEQNYGLVENFVVRFDASSSNYVGRYFGGVCYNNNGGTIRNGYVYAPQPLNATTAKYGGTGSDGVPDNSIPVNNVSLITVHNNGNISNIYASGSIAVEDYQSNHRLEGVGLLSSNGANLTDSFVIGDIYQVKWKKENGMDSRVAEPYTLNGLIRAGGTNANTRNNYYYSGLGLSYKNDFEGRQEQVTDPLQFRDLSFYNRTVNRDGSFLLDDVDAGFLPRLNMPVETMVRRQPRIALPPTTTSTTIRFLYAELDGEEHITDGKDGAEDYADATLVFSNILKRKIEKVEAEGLIVTPRDGAAEFEQGMEEGLYKVKVRLKPDGTRHSTRYKMDRFYYLGQSIKVDGRQIMVSFPKHVTNENWCEAFADAGADLFRLDEDIDFDVVSKDGKAEEAEKAIYSVNNGVFSGTFDGNGKSLKNFTLTKSSSLFGTTSGAVIRDLTLENFTISASANTGTDYRGLIGQCGGGTQISGIKFKNAAISNVRQYAGALAGKMSNSTVWDCVADGIAMDSDDRGAAMRVGGLVGMMESTRMENCFAKNLKIKIKAGVSAEGVGGLVGEAASANFIEEVYAHGVLESSFANTGGICGSLNSALSAGWTKVNISTQAPYVGGVAGLLKESGRATRMLVTGDVFTSAQDNFGRIVGGFYGNTRTHLRCYASAEQKINAEVSAEVMDAEGLMSAEELKKEFYYWDKPYLGSAFYYKEIESGALPKLYNKDGSDLLPYQEENISASSAGISFTASGEANLKEETRGTGSQTYQWADYEPTVTLRFRDARLSTQAEFDKNKEAVFGVNYANLTIEDMEIGKAEDGTVSASPVFSADGEGSYCDITISGIKVKKYVDAYRVILENGDSQSSAKLAFSDAAGGETPLYRIIYRAGQNPAAQINYEGIGFIDSNSWVGAMKLAGYGYENFLVMKDIDFTGVTDIQTQLRINRLEGKERRIDLEELHWSEKDIRDKYLMADSLDQIESLSDTSKGGFVQIRNLSYTERAANSVSWISELRGGLHYLNFKDITWTNMMGGSKVGIISTLSGEASYVDIEKLTFNYGQTSDYCGFFAYASGQLDYIRGRGIVMQRGSGSSGTNRIAYLGGIAGWTVKLVRHVGIKGSDDQPYTINGTGRNDYMCGGAVGRMMRSAIYAYVDNITVTNCYEWVGGLVGYSDTYTDINTYNKLNVEEKAGVPYLVEVKHSVINGNVRVGGVTGYYCVLCALSEENTVYAATNEAGGVSGRYMPTGATAIGCKVTAGEKYAGGICGAYSGSSYMMEVTGCTISAKEYAGGMVGWYQGGNNEAQTGYVKDSAVYSDECAGGVAGYIEGCKLYGGYVTGTIVGRKAKAHPEAEEQADGTYQAAMVGDTVNYGTINAGGIIGKADGAGVAGMAVDNVEVYAGQYAGGAIGYGGGSESFNLLLNTEVHADVSHAGGYAGYLTSYFGERRDGLAFNEANTKVYRVILTGTVGDAGTDYVGGFAGEFAAGEKVRTDPATGELLEVEGYAANMTKEYFSRIVLAQTAVNGKANTSGVVTGKDGNTARHWNEQIGYLRYYGSMLYNNKAIRQIANEQGWSWTAPWSLQSGGVTADRAYDVRTVNLKDRDFYYETLDKGGLYLADRADWKYADGRLRTGNFRNFLYPDFAQQNGWFPFVAATRSTTRRSPEGLDTALIDDAFISVQRGIPVPEDGLAAATFGMTDMSELFSQVSLYASGAGTINLEFPGDMVTDEEDVEILREELALAAEAMGGSDESDAEGSGKAGEGVESVGSGADIDPAWIPWARFTVYDGNGKALAENDVTRKVYTIPYDYDTTLTVKVAAGGETRSYAVTGDALRRTVMSYGEHCYYLKADGVYRDNGSYADAEESGMSGETVEGEEEIAGSEESDASEEAAGSGKETVGSETAGGEAPDYANVEKALGGKFIHLYKGKALDDNGRIFDLESGSQTGSLDADSLFVPGDAEIPAYETIFNGKTVKTYRMFTRSGADEEETDYRAFAKNGKLFGVDPALDRDYGQGFTDFVADYYSTSQGSTEYMSMLSEDHVLEDYKTPLNWPTDKKKQQLLRNFQIDEVGDNLNAANPYVILRYADRTTAAFNYLTGALLFIDDTEKEDLGLTEYAKLWLKGKKSALSLSNAYKGAAGVVGSLVENPIDDSLLVNYIKAPNTAGGDAESGAEVADIATDGTNKKKGTNTTTGSSTLGGAGSEAADGNAVGAGSEAADGNAVGAGSEAVTGSEVSDGSAAGAGETAVNGEASGAGSEAADGETVGAGSEAADGSAAGAGSEAVNGSEAVTGEISDKAETGKLKKAESIAESGSKQYTGGAGNAAVSESAVAGVGAAETATDEKTEEAGNGETAVSESAVAGAGAAETAKTEKAGEAEGTDTSGSTVGTEEAEVPLTSDRAYVTMVTAESDGYEVFRAAELLGPKGSAVLSENRKLKVLEENGLLQNTIDLESMKLTEEENRTGLLLVGAAAAAMVLLLALLYCRRRKMNV